MMHIVNLGAGVQSSTMALMAAAGEITPMPDAAIFADTGWEPQAVYDWLGWLETQLPFPVHRTRTDAKRFEGMTLRDFTVQAKLRDTKAHMPLPLFMWDSGNLGMSKRQCTRDWKIRPLDKLSKRLAGLKPGARLPTEPVVTAWIGISLDEIVRAKVSRDAWKTHRYPLLYEKQMRRADCLVWMRTNGYPEPPRSACIGCPYHSDYEWWRIRQNPDEWRDAVETDKAIRKAGGMRGDAFLHSTGRPLEEAVPIAEPNAPMEKPANLLLFGNECEGVCGV